MRDGGYIVFTVPKTEASVAEIVESLGWRILEVQDPDDLDGNGITIVLKVLKHDATQVADLEFFLDHPHPTV